MLVMDSSKQVLWQTVKNQMNSILSGSALFAKIKTIFWGVPKGSKKFFYKHGHVVYQIDGDDKQNRMQVKILS